MKAYQFPLLLIFIILAGLVAGVLAFPVSAEGDNPHIIQLSPTGQGRAHAVTYSPDGQNLAVGSSLGIFFFDSSDLQPIRFMPTDTWVRTLAFSPDGSMLASGSYGPIVRLWRANDGTLLKELRGHTAWVRALAFSPNGELLATASDDNTVRLWNVPDGTLFQTFDQGTEGVRTLAFSSDGTILATGGYDNIIRLLKISDGTLLRELKGHTDWVRALAFSPNDEWLASGAFDATVRIWRVSDGELLVTREEHNSSVLGLAFSPDGMLLASASVDTTVRLWKMPTAESYDLLKGHTDFVFSVAFSPDGKSLVSGAVDNTVRVWDVPQEASPSAQEIVSSPSNCSSCHHPLSTTKPARVYDVDCATCHSKGTMVRNWDPTFPRSGLSSPISVISETGIELGVPSQKHDLAVLVTSPGNGETFYAGEETPLYSMQLNGVVYSNSYTLHDINILVEILQNDRVIDSIQSQPVSNNGNFSLPVTVNPNTSIRDEAFASPLNKLQTRCGGSCHFRSELNLSAGLIYVRVTAIAPDGNRAADLRAIRVDHSNSVSIPVEVLLQDGQAVAGVSVQAVTRLYEWRGRTFTATSDSKGQASLQVEALSQSPTIYQIFVPPIVINGVLFESEDSVQVTLPPGATESPAVTLHVRTASGEISGHITNLDTPVRVWALSLPDGSANIASTSSQGTFSFANLRVGQYLLFADPQALAQQGLTLSVHETDLAQSPSAKIELTPQPLEGASLTGKITDENGTSLPFAWASVDTRTEQADPTSGAYALFGLPADKATVILSAPGYYSQAQVASASSLDFRLVRRLETRLFSWGAGTIILPSETVANMDGQTIIFEQGWLWGEGESEPPLIIQLDGTHLTIPSGRFALERLPAQAAWFYLFEGEARIQTSDTETPIEMRAGQMVRLEAGEDVQIVAYDPVVVQALRPAGESPISTTWQSSLSAQIRNQLALAGVNAAQVVTFVTYSLMTLVVVGLPFLGLYWWWKRRLDHAS